MMTTFFLIQTGILYIMVLKLSQSSVTHTFFLVVSFVFIIQRLLSDKAITAPQTHESNANSVQTPTISGYLLCKQSVYQLQVNGRVKCHCTYWLLHQKQS